MDELELNLDTVSDADANLEVEGAEAQIEDIQNRYPDEDYRTPEQQALDAEQAEGTAETVEPVETAEAVEPEVVEKPVTYGPNRFQEDPTTGLVNFEEVLATGVDPTLAKMANIQYQYGDDERQLFDEYHKAGGDINLEATYKLVTSLRNDELLTAKYDRNGDGQVSFSDWFDVYQNGRN